MTFGLVVTTVGMMNGNYYHQKFYELYKQPKQCTTVLMVQKSGKLTS